MIHTGIYRLITVLFFFCLLPLRTEAQFSCSVSPLPCFSNTSANTATAYVLTNPTQAVAYTWTITGPNGCTPTYTSIAFNASVLKVDYPCCGIYYFNCEAFDTFSLSLGTAGFSTQVNCSPTVTVNGPTHVCPGSTVTLVAGGGQSYLWNNVPAGSTYTLVPLANMIVTVVGTNSAGCSNSVQQPIVMTPTLNVSFSYTAGSNGNITFGNISTNTTSSTTYTWNFGNGVTSSNPLVVTTTYTSNGVYTVTLTGNSGCGPYMTAQTITVTNVPPSCVAAISMTQNPVSAGIFTFASSSSGTNASTSYTWSFGNGYVFTGSGTPGALPPPQSYTLNGVYPVTLTISNSSPACTSTAGISINLSAACLLLADFVAGQTGSNTISFTSMSTGTFASTSYTWNFGDGSSAVGPTGFHTYSAPGVYSVTLLANTGSLCSSTRTRTLNVTGCHELANFTHTIFPNGLVQFKDISQNPGSAKDYFWNFGDGIYSTLKNPSHSYFNAGIYNVSLRISDSLLNYCMDSLIQTISVTGIPCSANPGFTLTQTTAPQYWSLVPSYPWNVTAASWAWGDGSSSNSLYASHAYSAAGTYTICLSVTVSCGTSATYCSPYYIHKSGDTNPQPIYINVSAPGLSTGLGNNTLQSLLFDVFPNPNTGVFSLKFKDLPKEGVSLLIYDLLGKELRHEEWLNPDESLKTIYLPDAGAGIYFIKVISGNKVFIRKIVIQH